MDYLKALSLAHYLCLAKVSEIELGRMKARLLEMLWENQLVLASVEMSDLASETWSALTWAEALEIG